MKRGLSTVQKDRVQRQTVLGSGLNGGSASVRARTDRQNGGFRVARNLNRGMEKFGKRFDACNQPRTRPRKVTVGFQRVDAPVANGWHGIPLLGKIERKVFVARPLRAVAARRDKKNLRRRLHDIL